MVSRSSLPYCKHYASTPAGTDLAREKLEIVVTGITRDHVTRRTRIPIDTHRGICYCGGSCPILGCDADHGVMIITVQYIIIIFSTYTV